MYLLTIRAPALHSPAPAGRRALKYLVQQGAIETSSIQCRQSDATKSAIPEHRLLFEKTWTLSGRKPFEKLKLHIPGVTFVSVDPDADEQSVAKIRVTSDSKTIIERVDVASRFPNRTIVAYQPHCSESEDKASLRGNLMTEILLPRAGLLRNLASKGDGFVIVEDQVLATTADSRSGTIKLAATKGSQMVINSTRDVDVKKLQIAVANQGVVRLQAPHITVHNKIEIASAGGGNVHVQSLNGFTSPSMKLAIAGSGNIRVLSDGEIAIEDIKSAIAGWGDVRIGFGTGTLDSRSGVCGSQKIAIAGAGNVDIADLTTARVAVAVVGNGEVSVNVTDKLAVASMGQANVTYLSEPPQNTKCSKIVPKGVTHLSEDAQAKRKQQHEVEAREGLQFMNAIPTRESALHGATKVSLHPSTR